MRIVTLIVIAIFITGVSFADDRLDSIPSMSGKVEVMDQLGLTEPANSTEQVRIPKRAKVQQKVAPEKVSIRHLADIMTIGD